jgi:biopolymer transport protein ExbD
MKFPRNARILRGQLDAAPFAAVFFLLIIFALLTSLIYTPGIHIELPVAPAANITGVEGPTVAVAVDKHGRYYYKNQPISEGDLKRDLELAVKKTSQPLTLILVADKETTYDVISHLTSLAQSQGIKGVLWQTLPRPATKNTTTSSP